MANDPPKKGTRRLVAGIVETTVPGMLWPGIPQTQAIEILALHDQISQSQWWPRARLELMQLLQLSALLKHAQQTVPHYQRVLPAVTNLNWQVFRTLPTLTREQVQTDPAALVSRSIPAAHGAVGTIRSSGSTGRPVELRATQLAGKLRAALYLRDHIWQQRDFTLTAAMIRNFADGSGMPPQGRLLAGWGYAYTTRPIAALNIRATITEQLDWLQRVQPAYLVTFPTNARALVTEARTRGITFPGLRQISTFAESLPHELRTILSRDFGIGHSDVYSSEETGPIALQCGTRSHYHVQSENLIVEIVDDADQPCAPGQPGRVLVTDLHNFATPLIRYEIGDCAESGPDCDCGRGLPVITRVLGRTRDMLRLPDGGARWPTLPSGDELGRIAPVRQFQLVQKGPADLHLTLVVARPLSAEEEGRVRDAFATDLGGGFNLQLHYADSIARNAGGKYEDFRCEIPGTAAPG